MPSISSDNKQGLFCQETLGGVLCCPLCKGDLRKESQDRLECVICKHEYLIKDDIFVLMPHDFCHEQSGEREMREKNAQSYADKSPEEILKVISLHHSIPVMSERARIFRAKFNSLKWILDIGCGSGYYWRDTKGAKLILIDFVFSNLKSAKTMLKGHDNVIFVQSDAACLPVRPGSISGIWNVQVTQHFPDSVISSFQDEVRRVLLRDRFLIEIYNLNPAVLHRILYRVLGKKFHVKSRSSNMMVNRLNADELILAWEKIAEHTEIRVNYSELFFHPDLHLYFQNKYTTMLENLFIGFPWFAAFFARQIQVTISSSSNHSFRTNAGS